METIRTNVLRNSLRDEELTSNKGNNSDIFPCTWKNFKSLFCAMTRLIENFVDESTSPNGDEDVPVDPPAPQPVVDNGSEEAMKRRQE